MRLNLYLQTQYPYLKEIPRLNGIYTPELSRKATTFKKPVVVVKELDNMTMNINIFDYMQTRLCKLGRKMEIMPRSSKKEQRRTAATGSMGRAHLGEINVTRVKW